LGAHGAYNSLETILGAAKFLKHRNDIVFLFVGDGDEKSSMKKFAENNNLNNVIFMGTVPRSDSVELLALADCFLLPNRKGEFFKGNLPNKLFDFLASGAPIIVAGHGETADLILNSGACIIVNSEDSFGMANAIITIYDLPIDKRVEMGFLGRSFVKDNFNRSKQSEKLISILEE
jgi:glycosyltransferase involved in cell wall biosynthesis